jgi:Zn-dependent protease with chaperone function
MAQRRVAPGRAGGPVTSLVSRREQRHRRAVLLAVAALFVFSTAPVFGHHVAGHADRLLAGRDHVWFVCLVALHEVLAPVHAMLHVLLAGGAAYAVWDRVRASRALRRTLAVLDASPPAPGGALARAARAAGLDARRLAVVVGLPNPAFTAGLLHPRVYVAAELDARLDEEELTMVLAHEAEHLRRRDPLRLSVLRFLARLLFWLPALRRLADDVADEAEVAADDAAGRAVADPRGPLFLASALISLAAWTRDAAPMPAGAVVGAASRPDLLERRVRRLAGEAVEVGTHVTRRSVGAAMSALAVAWLSGLMMVHPMPVATAAHPKGDHCMRHHTLAVLHLLCPGFDGGVGVDRCPHTTM